MTHPLPAREAVARAMKKKWRELEAAVWNPDLEPFIDEFADAALSALGLSDGSRVIVPVEPTEAMVTQGHAAGMKERALWAEFPGDSPLPLRLILDYLPAAYEAMLTAAPPAMIRAQETKDAG